MAKSNQALAAAAIRKELKALGIKASVTSEGYSMGDSVNVNMTDELPATKAKVDELCRKYQYGHFDGMNDIYEYSNTRKDIPQSKHVFVRNEASDEMKERIYQHLRNHWAGGELLPLTYAEGHNVQFHHEWASTQVWRHFCDAESTFWQQNKAA